ncbi:MAG: putative lipid II flippase FtsW [Pseudomonadota bacterium]|nr:MAG: putative lipid II flippase FtsW [Pseudomonadota bacterium]
MRELDERTLPAPIYDRLLLWAVLGLTTLGMVMIYSASAVAAAESLGDSFHYVKRQLVTAGLGLGLMVLAMRTGYRRLEGMAYPLLLLALVSLVLVLIPGIGHLAGGARRWIRLGGLGFQPAELAKLAIVVYLARSLARKREKVRTFSIGFLPHTLVVGLFALLLLAQPDFGSAVLLGVLLFVMLFCAGAKISWLVGSVLLSIPVLFHLIATEEYRLRRFLAFLDPWKHRRDIGYQVAESLTSVGSGGLLGQGLGAGKKKLYYLPEAHTDFIFSVIGEELGLVGIALLVLLFGILIWRGIRAALFAPDAFGAYLALGCTALVGLQAVLNMLVALGLLPTKGLALPFVSYGGSSLVVSLWAAGMLLSISSGSGGFLLPQRSAR